MKLQEKQTAKARRVVPGRVDAGVAEVADLDLDLVLLRGEVIMGAVSARAPVQALVAIGANLGDAKGSVLLAIEALGRLPQTRCLRVSSLYRTAPFQARGPDFVNAVVMLETALSAPDLLQALQGLEHAAGRERPYLNAPRTLDLDIVTFGEATISSPHLTLPHPRWRERAFVVCPLRDVAPERVSEAVLNAVAGQIIERLE